jgi:hypothetical protein
MQQCPKCASSVPDGRTTCQICSAALDPEASKTAGPIGLQAPLAPQAFADEDDPANKPAIPGIDRQPEEMDVLQKQIGGGSAMASGGVELRRTLSGDVIEVPVAAPQRPGGPMLGQAGPAQGRSPMQPIPRQSAPGGPSIPPMRSGGGAVRGGETSGGGGSKLGIVLLILILVLGGGGAAGYWYWTQTRPAAAATEFMGSLQKKDWDKVYDQIELPSQARGMVNRDRFVKVMGIVGGNLTVESFAVEGSTITGDTAKVKMRVKASFGNQKSDKADDIPLKKVNGVWKVDATGGARGMPGMVP